MLTILMKRMTFLLMKRVDSLLVLYCKRFDQNTSTLGRVQSGNIELAVLVILLAGFYSVAS